MKKLNIFRYLPSAKIIIFLFVYVFVAQLFIKKETPRMRRIYLGNHKG